MKGDFSRIRFNPAKEYTAVLKQQGRVDLDSDANEQSAIDLYRTAKINVDVIGEFGGSSRRDPAVAGEQDNAVTHGTILERVSV